MKPRTSWAQSRNRRVPSRNKKKKKTNKRKNQEQVDTYMAGVIIKRRYNGV